MSDPREALATQVCEAAGKFRLGDPVRKIKGSQWSGRIVGTYSTELTPEGYAVESFTERGSVQIYPASALELCEEPGECVAVPRELLERAAVAAETGRLDGPASHHIRAIFFQLRKPEPSSLPLAYWEPCNPACDVDLGGARSRRCVCEQAKAALAQQGKAVGDE